MKISHIFGIPRWKPDGCQSWRQCPETTPHECSVPNCPGNINRLKLEAFGDIVGTLRYVQQFLDEYDVNGELHPSLYQKVAWALAKAKEITNADE